MPFHRSNGVEGYFASTSNTIDAVKVNIRNLLLTHQGERIMKPPFGNPLRDLAFEQMTEDMEINAMRKMKNTIEAYLPFVSILEFSLVRGDQIDSTIDSNAIAARIFFNIKNVPSMQGTVDVELSTADY